MLLLALYASFNPFDLGFKCKIVRLSLLCSLHLGGSQADVVAVKYAMNLATVVRVPRSWNIVICNSIIVYSSKLCSLRLHFVSAYSGMRIIFAKEYLLDFQSVKVTGKDTYVYLQFF